MISQLLIVVCYYGILVLIIELQDINWTMSHKTTSSCLAKETHSVGITSHVLFDKVILSVEWASGFSRVLMLENTRGQSIMLMSLPLDLDLKIEISGLLLLHSYTSYLFAFLGFSRIDAYQFLLFIYGSNVCIWLTLLFNLFFLLFPHHFFPFMCYSTVSR